MISKTSEIGIKALIFIGLQEKQLPIPPRRIAEAIGCSPTYLAKTLGYLTRSGILLSQRGAHGGVILNQAPESITLLAIVEACQGSFIANYCSGFSAIPKGPICAFHRAMQKVYDVTVNALSEVRLEDLLAEPYRSENLPGFEYCKMHMRLEEQFNGEAR